MYTILHACLWLSLLCSCAWSVETTIAAGDPALAQAVASDARYVQLADGFAWSEGPVWDTAAQRLLFSDVPKNRLYAWSANDGLSVLLEPSGHTGFGEVVNPQKGGSNGLAIDGQGHLILCQHGDRRVARLEADGSFHTLAAAFSGMRLNSPNDLAIAADGAIYFTDPTFGLPGNRNSKLRETPYTGVYRIAPDGAISLVCDDLYPNGIALSPDGRHCYIAHERELIAFTIDTHGGFAERTTLFTLPEADQGDWDGMAVDAAGHIFACNWRGGIYVLSPDGRHLGTISSGGQNANCCFGGPDGKTLFVTAGDKLLSMPVVVGLAKRSDGK